LLHGLPIPLPQEHPLDDPSVLPGSTQVLDGRTFDPVMAKRTSVVERQRLINENEEMSLKTSAHQEMSKLRYSPHTPASTPTPFRTLANLSSQQVPDSKLHAFYSGDAFLLTDLKRTFRRKSRIEISAKTGQAALMSRTRTICKS
jgi:hypothetical protein